MRDSFEMTRWTVQLVDGSVLEIWADGYEHEGGVYSFVRFVLLDEGEELPANATTPASDNLPRSCGVAVASLPHAAVALDQSGDSLIRSHG